MADTASGLTVAAALIDAMRRRAPVRLTRYNAISHELLADLNLTFDQAGHAWLVRPRSMKMQSAEAVGWADLAEGLASQPPTRPLSRPITLYGQRLSFSPPPTTAERHLAALEREARVIEDEMAAALLDELRAREWQSTSTSASRARASGDTPETFWDVAGITFEPADDTIWAGGELALRGVRFQRAGDISPVQTGADVEAHQPSGVSLRTALMSVRDPQTISDAITAVYDGCAFRGEPIPNINETTVAVRNLLKDRGLTATHTAVREIAEQPKFAERRGRDGVHRK